MWMLLLYTIGVTGLVNSTLTVSYTHLDVYKRQAYTWIVNISGLCGFIAWVGIAVSHYRFRRAFIAQGRDLSELPYKAWLFPVGPRCV